jgi:hypothetical protein
METTTTLYNGAPLAKCELLARLHNNHVHKFVARSGAEFRAYIEAEIAAARCGPAPASFDLDDDDEELVEPAPPVAVRRQRKRSLAKVCEAARKAGADRVIVDGVVIALSPAAAVAAESNGNEFDEWMARRHENPVKGH